MKTTCIFRFLGIIGIILIAQFSQAQTHSGTVTIEPTSTSAEKALEIKVPDSSTDFFRINNSTGSAGQFIPYVVGYHDTDNRHALVISAQTDASRDTGTNALLTFDARLSNNQVISNRPLFEWKSYTQQKMVLDADGRLGIGTSNPTSGRLHVYKNATTGGFGVVNLANAGVRIQDNSHSLYMDGNSMFSDGNLLIGTTAATSIMIGTNDVERFRISSDGKVGIGLQTPTEGLVHIYRNATTGSISGVNKNGATLKIQDNGSSLYVDGNTLYTTGNMVIGTIENTYFTIGTNQAERLRIDQYGNVSIGTTNSNGYKLAVNGNIRSKEIKVELNNWPDYVFTPSYNLQSLSEVETFINENGHLPNIPSAQEVEENNGIELGEMNAKLLEKIEELTLHLIQQNKELSELKTQNSKLIKRIEKIESSVEK